MLEYVECILKLRVKKSSLDNSEYKIHSIRVNNHPKKCRKYSMYICNKKPETL